jgi:hypothetical protein
MSHPTARSAALRSALTLLVASWPLAGCSSGADAPATGDGWTPLFNGTDLSGWHVPVGDNGHWRVVDGVIDYDALSEAEDDRNLWSERDFRDFTLQLEWRFPRHAGIHRMQNILPDGSYERDADGEVILVEGPNTDSGIYLRGTSKAQINLWSWPVGSGEVWGYRTDESMPPEVRAAVTPRVRADRPVGEWNEMEITMVGERLTVVLNGETVIDQARLPGIPESGPIALQHHGGMRPDGTMDPTSSIVQFRDIRIREY